MVDESDTKDILPTDPSGEAWLLTSDWLVIRQSLGLPPNTTWRRAHPDDGPRQRSHHMQPDDLKVLNLDR